MDLPARVWGLLALAALAPAVVGFLRPTLVRNRAVGIAARLAGRAVIVMALGLGVLATVATVAVVRTGLREVQRSQLPAVVELAARLGGGHQPGPEDTTLTRELTLFRAARPDASAVVAWGSLCLARCLAVTTDPGSLARVRAWALDQIDHPPDPRGLHTMTLAGELQLIVPAATRDSAGLPTGHLLVAMRAGWVSSRALETATLLLAIGYAFLAAVWWLTRRTVVAMVARRETDRRTADARALAARMESTAALAGGVAHDFNNLMAGIMTNAELLKHDLDKDAEARETIGTIIAAAYRGGQLAQQLLAFARGGQYQTTRVDLNALVRDAVRVEAHTVTPDVEVRTDLAPDLMSLEADPLQLAQVIACLHRNAVEALAGPGGGRITIATRNLPTDREWPPALAGLPVGAYAELSVADTGAGMSGATRERIFEPFFTTKGRGRGMGLATTYAIVTHHGGQIEVHSEPASGTVLRVYLPATSTPVGSN